MNELGGLEMVADSGLGTTPTPEFDEEEKEMSWREGYDSFYHALRMNLDSGKRWNGRPMEVENRRRQELAEEEV